MIDYVRIIFELIVARFMHRVGLTRLNMKGVQKAVNYRHEYYIGR